MCVFCFVKHDSLKLETPARILLKICFVYLRALLYFWVTLLFLRIFFQAEFAAEALAELTVPDGAVVCWEGAHQLMALVCLLSLIMYVLSTTLVSPFFMEDYTGRTEITFWKGYFCSFDEEV